jgi:hypothetical protein
VTFRPRGTVAGGHDPSRDEAFVDYRADHLVPFLSRAVGTL